MRDLAAFEERMARHLDATSVLGPVGRPIGLCMTRDDELFQLYVAAEARGSGAAAALLARGEAIIRERGTGRARLACAIGNEHAERFYRSHGWRHVGVVEEGLEVAGGVHPLRVGRFEKVLGVA